MADFLFNVLKGFLWKYGDSRGVYMAQRKTGWDADIIPFCIFSHRWYWSLLTNSMASSDLIHMIIPPESLPCVTDVSLTDGNIISLYPEGQLVNTSPLHQVSCKMMTSMSSRSFIKSECLLFRPKTEEFRPWIFHVERLSDFITNFLK